MIDKWKKTPFYFAIGIDHLILENKSLNHFEIIQ